MNRKRMRQLLPAMKFWAQGGTLHHYDFIDDTWKEMKDDINFLDVGPTYIMEDGHFEARKAHVMGEYLEYPTCGNGWIKTTEPDWTAETYRLSSDNEFNYPIYKEAIDTGVVVKFTSLYDWECEIPTEHSVKKGTRHTGRQTHENYLMWKAYVKYEWQYSFVEYTDECDEIEHTQYQISKEHFVNEGEFMRKYPFGRSFSRVDNSKRERRL